MIVVEERLRDLFDLIPEIQIKTGVSKKPSFSWGDKVELNRYLDKYKSSSYPLIWLLPSEDTFNHSSNLTDRNIVLILATLETRDELFNAQRFAGSYSQVLNPLTNYIIQAFESSNITRITSTDIKILKEPNYSDNGKHGAIDKWDAVRISLDVEFNNSCLKPIKWK